MTEVIMMRKHVEYRDIQYLEGRSIKITQIRDKLIAYPRTQAEADLVNLINNSPPPEELIKQDEVYQHEDTQPDCKV